jgi:hypothetical protein
MTIRDVFAARSVLYKPVIQEMLAYVCMCVCVCVCLRSRAHVAILLFVFRWKNAVDIVGCVIGRFVI